MKSTKWISEKLITTTLLLDDLQLQIEERKITEENFITEIYFFRNGNESDLTINEMLMSLVAEKRILTEILR